MQIQLDYVYFSFYNLWKNLKVGWRGLFPPRVEMPPAQSSFFPSAVLLGLLECEAVLAFLLVFSEVCSADENNITNKPKVIVDKIYRSGSGDISRASPFFLVLTVDRLKVLNYGASSRQKKEKVVFCADSTIFCRSYLLP